LKKALKDLTDVTILIRSIAILSLVISQYAMAFEAWDKVLVIVDDDVITQSDFDARMAQVQINLAQQEVQPSEEEVRKEVLDRLIIESLQLQLAKRSGVQISNERLTDAMNNIAQRNNMNLEQFKAAIEQQGSSYNEMREQVRKDMLIQSVQQGNLRNRIQISDEEIDNYLHSVEGKKITEQKYNVSHIILPIEVINKANSTQAEKDLLELRKQLLKGSKDDFRAYVIGKNFKQYKIHGDNLGWQNKESLPSLFAQYVDSIAVDGISEPILSGAGWHLLRINAKTGGTQIEAQTNSRHILLKPSEVRSLSQAHDLANELYTRLENGEDFTLLAKEYSDDTGSALQGGELGWSGTGKFVPEFDAALAKLEVNGISKPFTSQYGWHIVQKTGEREHDMTKEEWRNQAYQALAERKFMDELDSWLATIRNEAFIEFKE
jgi:peptidyl-prolyl cis-trans isomerase SurA